MQLGHAHCPRALKAHHADKIALQFAAFKRCQHFALVVEHDGRGFYFKMLGLHGRHFNHAAPHVAAHQTQAAIGRKRLGNGAQNRDVAAFGNRVAPLQLAVNQKRFLRISRHAMPNHGIHIIMQQARVAQFADNEWQAARRRKMIHIGLSVGIHANQQRNNR